MTDPPRQPRPAGGVEGPRFDGPRFARRVCLAAALAIAVWTAVRAFTFGYPLERSLWLARTSGWTAASALLLSLSMTPLGRLAGRILPARLPASQWPALRRALGITAALSALVHAAIVSFGYLDRDWPAIITLPYLRAGLVTLAILVPLLVTSFPRITKALRIRLWKPLHRLAYLAALFLLQHLLLSPFAPRRTVLLVFGMTFVLGLLRLVPARRRVKRAVS